MGWAWGGPPPDTEGAPGGWTSGPTRPRCGLREARLHVEGSQGLGRRPAEPRFS